MIRKAMVFAAGLGTRLKPVTDELPKALVPVCGVPLLKHVLLKLKRSGIDDVVVNVHHFAGKIEDYLRAEDNFGMNISISDERDMLRETGGGIRHAERFLAGHHVSEGEDHVSWRSRIRSGMTGQDDGHFLVHNVDIISDLDIGWFESQVHPNAVATLLVSERKTNRYLLFDDDMRLVGWTNTATGEIRSPFPGLDVASCRKSAFSGIHIISDRIFPLFGSEGFGDRFPIMDFYLKAADRYPIYGVQADGLRIVDVGKTDALSRADALVRGLI